MTVIFNIVIMLALIASPVYASHTFLVVDFDPDPLFMQENFLPQDETSGVVTVTNNSGAAQNILTEAINILDNDSLGSLLHLKIVGSSGILFDTSLANFFATAGEVPLGEISDKESKIFTYTISFINSNDNSYQGKTLGFDLCVGFQGGNTHCGDTVIGSENHAGEGGATGAPPDGAVIPGSGGGSGQESLTVFNEVTLNIVVDDGTATIEWDTNLLATSQVIFGTLSGGLYVLNINNLPNLGYPSGTVEDPIKTLHHSVTLTGLVGGETYVYRVVSRASPPTVSKEYTFIMPESIAGTRSTGIAQADPGALTIAPAVETVAVKQEPFLLNSETEDNSNLLAFTIGGLDFDLYNPLYILFALLVTALILLFWFVYRKKKDKK